MPSAVAINQRPRYRPSGKVAWGTFLPLAMFTFAVALILAAGMNWLFSKGWYLLFLVPFAAMGLLLGPIVITVTKGKCRRPFLAGLFGLLAGVLLYGGYLYFGMVSLLGSPGLTRFDLLPNYISLRLHSDVHHDVERPAATPERPDPVANGIMFAIEAGVVLFLTFSAAHGRSKRAFCEKCDLWKQQHVVTFAPGYAKQITQWFEQGELANLAALPLYVPKGKKKRSTMVAIECCNWEGSKDCPVYLAVKEVSKGGGLTAFDGATGKAAIARIQLTPAEMIDLTPVFPQLTERSPTQSQQAAANAAGGPLIEVQTLPAAEAHRVLNARSKIIGNVLTVLILFVFWGSIAGVIGGLYQAKIGDPSAQNQAGELKMIAWLGVTALSLLLAVFSGYVGLKNSGVPGNLYYRYLARRAIALRKTKWVDPARPGDLPIYFVQVVPRKNWGTLMLETATDTGFLQIDPRRGEIRFEGDVERYRIPTSAITSCSLATYSSSAGKSSIEYCVVVIQGNTAKGKWEAPVSLRQTNWLVPASHRKQTAQMILDQITPLISTDDFEEVALEDDDQPAKSPVAAPPRREGWLRSNGLRTVASLFFIGLAIWRGISNGHSKNPNLPNRAFVPEKEIASVNTLGLNIGHIQRDRQLIAVPPFQTSGGNWTLFDCTLATDPETKFTVAVEKPSVIGSQLFSFSHAAILPGDIDSGRRLLSALANVLHQTVPTEKTPEPLVPYKMPTAILGQHLSSPQQGLKNNSGTWVATKWFIQNDGLDAEIYFNYDLSSGRAELSEKDASYNADVLLGLASAVRDGPRPPRSAQNDPGFTEVGPTVVDLQAIPDSAKCSVAFARGGKLLTLIHHGSPSIITGLLLQNPQPQFALAQCDGKVTQVICADPDGNQLVVTERRGASNVIFNGDGQQLIWWIDRTTGTKRQLTGPWGAQGWIAGDDIALSPDSRYLGIGALSGTILDKKRSKIVYLIDVQKGTSVQAKADDCYLTGWTGTGNLLRATLATGNQWASDIAGQTFLANPETGDTVAYSPPSHNLSPDGRKTFTLHPKMSLDVTELSSGHTQTFTFHPDDLRFAEEGNFHWLNSRYIQFDTMRSCFIDTASMKLGYLPTNGTDDEEIPFRYSPDFRWAITSEKTGIALGRVVEPQEP